MDIEFLDLGLVKIKVEHPVSGFDNLLARPEEQRPSNWEVPASPEQYKEEIGATDYIWVLRWIRPW